MATTLTAANDRVSARARAAARVDDVLAARVMPTSSRRDRQLPLLPPLLPLLPGGALLRGSVVGVDTGTWVRGSRHRRSGAGGATTLAFSLLAGASTTGAWCAAVGTDDPGVLSLSELGVDLGHLAIVPLTSGAAPDPSRLSAAWPEVTAALLEGMDIVLLRPPWPARSQVARRLAARARERQAVLIVLAPRAWWPEGPDVNLEVTAGKWHGVGQGHGHLQGRRVEVRATGRRSASKPVSTVLWLPAPSGAAALADAAPTWLCPT